MTNSVLSTRGSVLTVGFIALDVVVQEQHLGHSAGGTAGNVAANLAFLGWQASAGGVIGADPAGRQVVSDLGRAGVDVSSLDLVAGCLTPVVIHEILEGGHRFRFGCPQCGRRFPRSRPLTMDAARRIAEKDRPDVFFFDRVSAGAIWLAETLREMGGLVVFEPATRGRPAGFRRAMELAHVVKYSSERQGLTEDLLRPGASQLQVRTSGAEGVAWRVGRGGWHRVPAVQGLTIYDTGGAGDWMTAGLLASLESLRPAELLTANIECAMRGAQALAALSCSVAGARGMGRVMTVEEVRDAVGTVAELPPAPRPLADHRPARSRRRAECAACLGDASR